jgi:hypothetical protein
MAAPALGDHFSFTFRDAKGQTSRMRFLIGDATQTAVITNYTTIAGHLVSASNGNVSSPFSAVSPLVYGTNAQYPDVEDKAVIVFADPAGALHRFQLPAPVSACFTTDGETVANSGAMGAVITDISTFVYGRVTDTAPLVYIGGMRARRKMQRRFNIITKNPALSGPGL